MEIDSHILGLSMEFEKQNIIITEWETEKAKSRSDNIYDRRKRKRIKKRQPKIYLEPTDSEPNDDEEDDMTRNRRIIRATLPSIKQQMQYSIYDSKFEYNPYQTPTQKWK